MSSDIKYIGLDVHKEAITIAVRNGTGKLVMESIVETKASSLVQFLHGQRGELQVTLEEGTWAAWLCAQAFRAVARRNAATGLPQRKWTAQAARVGAELSDHQQRFEAGDESAQGAISRLGHSLCRYPGLCSPLSRAMAEQDCAGWCAPPRGAVLSTSGWTAGFAAPGTRGIFGREPET